MRFSGGARSGEADLVHFTHLVLVGKSADRLLVSPADLPTGVIQLASVTYRVVFLVVKSCRIAALQITSK